MAIPQQAPAARCGWVVSIVLGVGVAAIAGLVWLFEPTAPFIPVLLVMSAFAVFRSVSIILTTFLYIQHRDGHRVLAGGVAAVVKLALIVLIGPVLGAFGAALAAVVVELMVAIWFFRVVYSWRPGLPVGGARLPPPSGVVP